MKKLLLLINPSAGKSAIRSQLIDVIDTFNKADYQVTSVVTQNKGHLSETVMKTGNEYDTVVCCGGDGTLNITVSALCELEEPPVLGYIPAGTTNDFAKSRGISSIPTGAARQIAEGEVRNIDLGFLGGRPYVYVAAFGMLSNVSYETPRQLKQNIGHAAYLLEGIKAFSKHKSYNISFRIDGELLEGEFICGMLTNTRRVGGFSLPIISDLMLDDGVIDITLVKKPRSADDTTKLFNAVVTQQPDDNMVYQIRANSISYESDKMISWTLDGEFGGSYKRQSVQLREHFLKIVY